MSRDEAAVMIPRKRSPCTKTAPDSVPRPPVWETEPERFARCAHGIAAEVCHAGVYQRVGGIGRKTGPDDTVSSWLPAAERLAVIGIALPPA